MDFSESTKIVYDRIQKIDPENVSKIVGYLLLQDHGEREMIRLAYCPDNLIHSLIKKAKSHLNLLPNSKIPEMPLHFTPFTPSTPTTRHSPLTIQIPSQPVDYLPMVNYPASFPEDYNLLHNHNRLRFLDDPFDSVNSVNSPDFSLGHIRANRRSPSLPEFPFKVCHYFIKGFCRHGNNCRYLHPTSELTFNYFEDETVFSPGSLEKLELELTELLKARKGFPLSIASLPMMYYEKFGKSLQAEGYLTESQRHGKAGYSLTKLLARLKSICLIDRPHGQHAVILADDLAKCMDHNGDRDNYRDRNEHGGIVAGSKQIYLTFPAESTFSERDVFNYFNKFGAVHDVRIPCQQKRMFGFVTFIHSETVRHILNKGNPHFVSGARVLVKPYREKSKPDDSLLLDINVIRKHGETFQASMYQGGLGLDSEIGLQSMPRICDNSRLIKKQLIEEQQEQALEFERRHFSEMQLSSDPNYKFPCFRTSIEELRLPEGNSHGQQMNFRYLLDYLNNGPSNDERIKQINTKYNEESSQGINLPDSPFAPALGGEIPTVI
ncbi:hypothetical protein LXL04_037999 [Taraxacum kok-saghyz]